MSMFNVISCPACGSDSVHESTALRAFSVPYGREYHVNEVVNTCATCGESGDFAERNEALLLEQKDKALKQSVASMIEHLSAVGISMAYFERALRLPARTLARWKEGQASASSVALLRLVRTYPWILEVADADFDAIKANVTLVQASAAALAQAIPTNSLTWVTNAHAPETQQENKFTVTRQLSEPGTTPAKAAREVVSLKTKIELVPA